MNPLLDSGNSFWSAVSESAFATADFDCSNFPHISKIEDPPISSADVERSEYQDGWNDCDYAEFSGLWNSNASRRLKKEELPKNASVVTGKWVINWKTDDDRGNVINTCFLRQLLFHHSTLTQEIRCSQKDCFGNITRSVTRQ